MHVMQTRKHACTLTDRSWKRPKWSDSLCQRSQLAQRATSVPFRKACGLTRLWLRAPQHLHVNAICTCGWAVDSDKHNCYHFGAARGVAVSDKHALLTIHLILQLPQCAARWTMFISGWWTNGGCSQCKDISGFV